MLRSDHLAGLNLYETSKQLFISLGSLSERAGVRAKLGGDPEWQAEYFQKENTCNYFRFLI